MKNEQYTKTEKSLFKSLSSSAKIQDFLNTLKFNFEKNGETCYSPRMVLKHKTAHCMEGAMLAAAVLEFHGHKPLVLDLRSVKPHDDDHVVALFKQFGCWGAISKTNHSVLRYREPVYKTIRELVLSFFHEYFLDNGKKTLREYSEPFDLRYFDNRKDSSHLRLHQGFIGQAVPPCEPRNWRTSSEHLFEIPKRMDKVKHYKILTLAQIKNLRKAEKIEIESGKLVEWTK